MLGRVLLHKEHGLVTAGLAYMETAYYQQMINFILWRKKLQSSTSSRVFFILKLSGKKVEIIFGRFSFLCDSLYFTPHTTTVPVAVYDGCGIVAFVYWLRLKQYL